MDAAKELLKKKAENFFEIAKDYREAGIALRAEAKQSDDAADQYEADAKQYLAAAEKLV